MPDRLRTLLGAALAYACALLLLTVGGTEAMWSESATIQGTTMSTGRIDVRVDGSNQVTGYTALDASGLVPGRSVASTLVVGNQGTVPLEYVVGVTGPAGNALFGALTTKVTTATSVTVGAGGRTCGGTAITGARTLASLASETVCVQATLPPSAPVSAAGTATALTVTAQASLGGWSDDAPVTGTRLESVALTAPTIRCGPLALGLVTIEWDAVPGATAYRIHHGLGGSLLSTVSGDTLSHVFTGVTGEVRVQAVFGSDTWVSPKSNALAYSALGLVLGTCS